MIDAVDKGRRLFILSRCGNNDVLRTCFDMIHRLFGRDISTGTIDDIIDAGFFPWNFQRIGAGKYIDMLAIDINPGLIVI